MTSSQLRKIKQLRGIDRSQPQLLAPPRFMADVAHVAQFNARPRTGFTVVRTYAGVHLPASR